MQVLKMLNVDIDQLNVRNKYEPLGYFWHHFIFQISLPHIRFLCVTVVERFFFFFCPFKIKERLWSSSLSWILPYRLSTVISEGQMMTMRGCATRSFCRGDLSSQISQNNTVAVGLTCCKGHLCNSSKTIIQTHLVQLSLLLCTIVHMLL